MHISSGQIASQAQYIADRVGSAINELTNERDELRIKNERMRIVLELLATDERGDAWVRSHARTALES